MITEDDVKFNFWDDDDFDKEALIWKILWKNVNKKRSHNVLYIVIWKIERQLQSKIKEYCWTN